MGAAKKLPVLVINNLLRDEVTDCVRDIFKSGFKIDVQLDSFQKVKQYALVGDASGLVGMVQDELEGNLAISFHLPVIARVFAQLYPGQIQTVNEDVRQGVAEIANMVYGQLKVRLNARGYDLKMALPNFITGAGHAIHQGPSGDIGVLKFKFEDEYIFEVVISCHKPGMI